MSTLKLLYAISASLADGKGIWISLWRVNIDGKHLEYSR